MDKVIGGTPKSSPNLCISCSHSLVLKSSNLDKKIVCGFIRAFEVPFEVAECNRYSKDGEPDKYDMEKIAWTVETRSRGPKGFVGGENEVIINPPKKRDND